MGDRANIQVKDDWEPGVFLYTHWAGTELPLTLKYALEKKWRWDDTSYLARIIFETMIEAQRNEELGYGISSKIGDNTAGRPIIVVDCLRQAVTIGDKSWSFEKYILLPEDELLGIWG